MYFHISDIYAKPLIKMPMEKTFLTSIFPLSDWDNNVHIFYDFTKYVVWDHLKIRCRESQSFSRLLVDWQCVDEFIFGLPFGNICFTVHHEAGKCQRYIPVNLDKERRSFKSKLLFLTEVDIILNKILNSFLSVKHPTKQVTGF